MMLGGRRAVAVVVTTFALAGCNAANPTGSTDTSALVGPTWTLTLLNGQSPVSGTKVTAVFSTESRVSGSAGCNSYFGSAAAETGRLTIGRLGSTLMACHPEAVMAQESSYLRALETTTRFVVNGDELRLGPSATEATLVFTSR